MSDVRVRVADHAVRAGAATLSTVGLGSCVAVVLHAPRAGIGGLAHVLLPEEGLSRDRENRAKFATTAIPLLLEEMSALSGGAPLAITARLIGGARMFAQLLPQSGINMGERNVQATRATLAEYGIPVVAEDTGADYGRSVYFDVASGRVTVKSLKAGDRVL
jgi:chemotaxis protein CheD